MNDKATVLRDSVKGENKYARIPIRRTRTPIDDKEILEIEKFQQSLQMNDEQVGRLACLLSDVGFPHFAGKIFSYIDAKNGKEYASISFISSDE